MRQNGSQSWIAPEIEPEQAEELVNIQVQLARCYLPSK